MNVNPVKFAQFYAAVKHAAQSYSGLPYTHHLAAVAEVLKRFGFTSPEHQCAGWLHDTVEDTGTKVKEIEEIFGEEVALLVDGVSDEPGETRAVRKMLTYPKIRQTRNAVIIKLGDRIANVEHGLASGHSMTKRYKKEQEEFYFALYHRCVVQAEYVAGVEAMWAHLNKLLGFDPVANHGASL